ncbi:aspartic peptidase domain-containing protein [Dactylonectria macrodidyma]|uniref:Aspartic peptidase domain-containing protein n=1 Tax=Dactylonectria macrodidyma TaxID=307937 RepID=A0A9P9JD19_9HYPO|nr:aspartic peptidase domain-containing protein [Dactylonectria macrodidyma]
MMLPSILLSVALLQGAAVAAPSQSQPPTIPISYSYGGYPRVQADIKWGTPGQSPIPTIFDTGSPGFWVFGPKSIINDGSSAHYVQGPCNKTVKTFYNWPKSTSHSKGGAIKPQGGTLGYAYGGNGKLVSAPAIINDTFAFSNPHFPKLINNQVGLANYVQVAQLDDGCKIPESDFDHSILGLAPLTKGFSGPSFRDDLRRTGKTKSSSFSMWFDRQPKSIKSPFSGAAVFGAVPSKAKYTGELVRIKQNYPTDLYVGYYSALPGLTVTSIRKPGKPVKIGLADSSVKRCLLDSGTGEDRLPFSSKELIKATGLIELENPLVLAWNGTCESIPRTASLNFTFVGATAGKKVTVAVPIRSYARGEYDEYPGYDASKYCALSLSADEYGSCTFGAPFFTAVYAVFHDDKKQIALAQGGVSTGSADGLTGIGQVTPILSGSNIPNSV